MPGMRNASLSTHAINERRIQSNSLVQHSSSPASTLPPSPSEKALSPTVIENLPPGLNLTPPQLLSLHAQLLIAGAFEPVQLTRQIAEHRDRHGRHIQKFSGPRWTISLLLHPEAQTGSCTPDDDLDSKSTTPPSSCSPFTSVSLWCIATVALDLDLTAYTRPQDNWLTRTLNLLASPFVSSPSTPQPSPQQHPQVPICVYLFDVPTLASLPTQPGRPWRRLPRLPRPTPPWSLSTAAHPHGHGLLSALCAVDVRTRASRSRARGVRREGRPGGARGSVGGRLGGDGGRGDGRAEGALEAPPEDNLI